MNEAVKCKILDQLRQTGQSSYVPESGSPEREANHRQIQTPVISSPPPRAPLKKCQCIIITGSLQKSAPPLSPVRCMVFFSHSSCEKGSLFAKRGAPSGGKSSLCPAWAPLSSRSAHRACLLAQLASLTLRDQTIV